MHRYSIQLPVHCSMIKKEIKPNTSVVGELWKYNRGCARGSSAAKGKQSFVLQMLILPWAFMQPLPGTKTLRGLSQ